MVCALKVGIATSVYIIATSIYIKHIYIIYNVRVLILSISHLAR